jgi:hypothetical protein
MKNLSKEEVYDPRITNSCEVLYPDIEIRNLELLQRIERLERLVDSADSADSVDYPEVIPISPKPAADSFVGKLWVRNTPAKFTEDPFHTQEFVYILNANGKHGAVLTFKGVTFYWRDLSMVPMSGSMSVDCLENYRQSDWGYYEHARKQWLKHAKRKAKALDLISL